MPSSERLLNEIIALRRTPPTTTTSPTLHIRSWHSIEDSLRPSAFLNICTEKLNKSTKGAGPLALPPKVLRRAPAGRTFVISHFGISPAQSRAKTCLKALAQPSLLSRTDTTVSLSIRLGTSGSLSINCLSTENPTPVPHSKINIASSKALTSSTAR